MTGVVALVLAIVALAGLVAVGYMVAGLRGRLGAIPQEGDVYQALGRIDQDLSRVEEAAVRMEPLVESLVERMPGALRYAAVVTFDAHGERTGHQSRAIALLNERRDGLVITLLHGAKESMFYAKMIRDGKGVEPLSPEEATAVERALQR
jgi:hypothetical protein